METLNEKCAVAAIVSQEEALNAAAPMYEMLFAQQHRGTESSGITTQKESHNIATHRGIGMVRDVYNEESIHRIAGSVAIGHNRYSTSGSKIRHPQPIIDQAIGLAFGHNGNLPVTKPMEDYLQAFNIKTEDMNDTEMMGNVIAQYIRHGMDLPTAIRLAYPHFRGAFSCVALHDNMVVAFRDPKGIRPLALGTLGDDRIVSSETCGLEIIGAEYDREVQPGEMVVITKGGIESFQLADDAENKLDIFEFVYFARHDSMLYGQSVNEVRRRFGQQLAEQHQPFSEKDRKNVLVVPIPDTSIPAAEGYADALGLHHRQAVIKNRYIGRTFIEPTAALRTGNLRRKHNIIPQAIHGRDVIFIDDSIVRFNTMPRLVQLALSLGAKSVSVLIASSPVRFPDHYGIDTPLQTELAAANMTTEEMRKAMGNYKNKSCKYLGFLSLSRMVKATAMPMEMFNLSCFTGEYPLNIGHHRQNIKEPVSWEYIKD